MPLHWRKHLEEALFEISDFHGGVNVAVPRSLIADNECEWIENFYFDATDGRLVTRWPLKRYSSSAISGSPSIDGLYYWNGEWLLVASNTLYYLDANKDPQEIGSLNGTERPSFCPFNDVLVIASGSTIQQLSASRILSDVTNGPKGTYVMQKNCRLIVTGDPDNPSRVHQSNYFDQTDWAADGSDYADVGYKDGLSVIGIHEAFDGLYLVFKRSAYALATYFMTSLSEATPSASKVSDLHCARTHHSVVDAASKVYFLETNGVSVLVGTDTQGKIVVDPTVGQKLSGLIETTSSGYAVVHPPDRQIWFVPDPSLNKVYVCHYMMGNAWTIFSFGDRKIKSAFYLPNDEHLYLGCDDGYLYRYESNDFSFQDEGGTDYTQIIRTKDFDSPPDRDKVVKVPQLFYAGLTTGSGVFSVKKTNGSVGAYSSNFTISTSSIKLYAMQSTKLYDTQEDGSSEMFLYDVGSEIQQEKFDVNIPLDDFQFKVKISSGGLKVDRIIGNLAASTRK